MFAQVLTAFANHVAHVYRHVLKPTEMSSLDGIWKRELNWKTVISTIPFFPLARRNGWETSLPCNIICNILASRFVREATDRNFLVRPCIEFDRDSGIFEPASLQVWRYRLINWNLWKRSIDRVDRWNVTIVEIARVGGDRSQVRNTDRPRLLILKNHLLDRPAGLEPHDPPRFQSWSIFHASSFTSETFVHWSVSSIPFKRYNHSD